MTVETRAERSLCVVQVKREHPAAPHGCLALRHRATVAGPGAEIVAGGEQMARVQANADPLGPGGALEQGGQLVECPADRVPGAGRVLERYLDPIARGPCERLVERGRDPADPRLESGAHVRAGMDDHA